jgi:solute carrier family 35, member E1
MYDDGHAGGSAVSFVHIVKALEPVFMALLSASILGEYFSALTYLSLVPITAGVAMASASEFSFSWLSFWMANISNFGSVLRGRLPSS